VPQAKLIAASSLLARAASRTRSNMPAIAIRKLKRLAWPAYNRFWTSRCDKKLALVLDRIAAADLDDLRRLEFVEGLIQHIGLVKDKRQIYGDDETYMNPIPRGLHLSSSYGKADSTLASSRGAARISQLAFLISALSMGTTATMRFPPTLPILGEIRRSARSTM
jgi:hypothetical protein